MGEDDPPVAKVPVYLTPGSLIFMSGEAHYLWKHDIYRAPGFQKYEGEQLNQMGRISITLRELCQVEQLINHKISIGKSPESLFQFLGHQVSEIEDPIALGRHQNEASHSMILSLLGHQVYENDLKYEIVVYDLSDKSKLPIIFVKSAHLSSSELFMRRHMVNQILHVILIIQGSWCFT